MNFKLKINPEAFSTPDRMNFTVTSIEAYPIGAGDTTDAGIEQLKFYFSFLGADNEKFADTNANVETVISLPNGVQYQLLASLFSNDVLTKYEAMSIVASSYGYTALPFDQQ